MHVQIINKYMQKRSFKLVKKKSCGKSQFIKERLENEYNPKYRITSYGFKQPYKSQPKEILSTAQQQKIRHETIKSIHEGKQITLDWEHKNHFHIRPLPLLKRSENGSLDNIAAKRNHLQSLLKSRKQVSKPIVLKTQPKQNELLRKTSSWIWHPQRDLSFLSLNKDKINEVLSSENSFANPEQIFEQCEKRKKSMKLNSIKERLAHKGKLALLKSSIIRKFNQSLESADDLDDSD